MVAALLLGLSYGFAAGVSPGPTMTLVIVQTVQRGRRAGMLTALAPLLTDAPIILLTVLAIGALTPQLLAWVGLIGGIYVVSLGVETVRAGARGVPEFTAVQGGTTWRVLRRAMLTNALSPHPYLFWAAAGAPTLVRSIAAADLGGAALFLVGFYTLLVGSKLLLAQLVARSRDWLQGALYRHVLTISGCVLMILGGFMGIEAVRTLFGIGG